MRYYTNAIKRKFFAYSRTRVYGLKVFAFVNFRLLGAEFNSVLCSSKFICSKCLESVGSRSKIKLYVHHTCKCEKSTLRRIYCLLLSHILRIWSIFISRCKCRPLHGLCAQPSQRSMVLLQRRDSVSQRTKIRRQSRNLHPLLSATRSHVPIGRALQS